MSFFKKLGQLVTGGGSSAPADVGLYFYVRSKATGNVYAVRINPNNDLSMTDDGQGYTVRKVVVGKPSYDRMEVTLRFTTARKLVEGDSSVTGGDLVDEAAYRAFQATQPEA